MQQINNQYEPETFELSLRELLHNIRQEVNSNGYLVTNPFELLNLDIIYQLLRMLKRKSDSQKREISDWLSNPNQANELLEKCKESKYEFGTAKQTTIKTNGKERLIYSYRTNDKIVLKFLSLVLNEIYNPDFYPTSFAYRPNLSIQAGMKLIEQQSKEDNYCIKLDIHKCFNNIDTEKLIKIIEDKVKHPQFLKIIKKSLCTYTKVYGKKVKHSGIPQGSVHAPILSNIYLHFCLDKPLRETYPNKAKLYRYADDIYITMKENTSNQINEWLEHNLRDHNLSISEKTPNVTSELKNGQQFLGYKIEKERDQLTIDIDETNINQKIIEICLTKPEHLPNYLRSQIKSMNISKETQDSWHNLLVALPHSLRKKLNIKVNQDSLENLLAEIDLCVTPLLRELGTNYSNKSFRNQCMTES
ncbi:reverse transcriptase/maturase family protein [Leptospira bouyouniensis]|nr:reverse transcriptase/maturase family protein [Leptospira bouyouniensis]